MLPSISQASNVVLTNLQKDCIPLLKHLNVVLTRLLVGCLSLNCANQPTVLLFQWHSVFWQPWLHKICKPNFLVKIYYYDTIVILLMQHSWTPKMSHYRGKKYIYMMCPKLVYVHTLNNSPISVGHNNSSITQTNSHNGNQRQPHCLSTHTNSWFLDLCGSC